MQHPGTASPDMTIGPQKLTMSGLDQADMDGSRYRRALATAYHISSLPHYRPASFSVGAIYSIVKFSDMRYVYCPGGHNISVVGQCSK